jgi:hypothetical protein
VSLRNETNDGVWSDLNPLCHRVFGERGALKHSHCFLNPPIHSKCGGFNSFQVKNRTKTATLVMDQRYYMVRNKYTHIHTPISDSTLEFSKLQPNNFNGLFDWNGSTINYFKLSFFRNAQESTPFSLIDRRRTIQISTFTTFQTHITSNKGRKPHNKPMSFDRSTSSTMASNKSASFLDLFLKIRLFLSIQIDRSTRRKRERASGRSLEGHVCWAPVATKQGAHPQPGADPGKKCPGVPLQ